MSKSFGKLLLTFTILLLSITSSSSLPLIKNLKLHLNRNKQSFFNYRSLQEEKPTFTLSTTETYIESIHIVVTVKGGTCKKLSASLYRSSLQSSIESINITDFKTSSGSITLSKICRNCSTSKYKSYGDKESFALKMLCDGKDAFPNDTLVNLVVRAKTDKITVAHIDYNTSRALSTISIKTNFDQDYFYQVVIANYNGSSNNDYYFDKKIISDKTEINLLDFDKKISKFFVIIFNKNDQIEYITNYLTLINLNSLLFHFDKTNYFLTDSDSEHIETRVQTEVPYTYLIGLQQYLKGTTDPNKIISFTLSSSADKFVFKSETLAKKHKGKYKLHFKLVDYDKELDYYTINVYGSLKELYEEKFTGHSESDSFYKFDNSAIYYYKSDIRFTFPNRIDDKSINAVLQINLDKYEFSYENNEFYLPKYEIDKLTEGLANIILYEGNLDNVFYKKQIYLTDMKLSSQTKSIGSNEEIIFTNVAQYNSNFTINLIDTKNESYIIPLTCTYTQKELKLTCPQSARPGNYYIQVGTNMSFYLGNIIIYETSTDIPTPVIHLPENLTESNNVIEITTKNISSIVMIQLSLEGGKIWKTYERLLNESQKDDTKNYFYYDCLKTKITIILDEIDLNTKYFIQNIIYENNLCQSFNNQEYLIQHIFSIDSEFYFPENGEDGKTEFQITFDSAAKKNSYSSQLYIKIENENSVKLTCESTGTETLTSKCSASINDLNKNKLISAYIGYKENIYGSQKVYIIGYSPLSSPTIFKTSTMENIQFTLYGLVNVVSEIKVIIIKTINGTSSTSQQTTGITKSNNDYVIKLDTNKIELGNYQIKISLTDGVIIPIPKLYFTVYEEITLNYLDDSSKRIYLSSTESKLEFKLNRAINHQDKINGIVLVQKDIYDTTNAVSFDIDDFTDGTNTVSATITLSKLLMGNYSISFKDISDAQHSTELEIEVVGNEIKNTSDLEFLEGEEAESKTYTFEFMSSNNLPEKIFLADLDDHQLVYNLSPQGASVSFTLSKTDFVEDESYSGRYDVYFIYSGNVYIKENIYFSIKSAHIELEDCGNNYFIGETYKYINILLKGDILREQIEKIVMFDNLREKNIIKDFSNKYYYDNKLITIDVQDFNFNEINQYFIAIYEVNVQNPLTYLINICQPGTFSESKFNITFKKIKEVNGITEKEITISRTDTTTYKLVKKVELFRIDKITGETKNMSFCNNNLSDNSSCAGFISKSNDTNNNTISFKIVHTKNESYRFKYFLNRIIGYSEGQSVQFDEDKYVYEDYTMTNDLHYTLENIDSTDVTINLFDESIASKYKDTMKCYINNQVYTNFTCGISCTKSETTRTALNCHLYYGKYLPPPFTVLIKFSDEDANFKYINFINITKDKNDVCYLSGLEQNLTFTIRSEYKFENFMLYINDQPISDYHIKNINYITYAVQNKNQVVKKVTIPYSTITKYSNNEEFYVSISRKTDKTNKIVLSKALNYIQYSDIRYTPNSLTPQLSYLQNVYLYFKGKIDSSKISRIYAEYTEYQRATEQEHEFKIADSFNSKFNLTIESSSAYRRSGTYYLRIEIDKCNNFKSTNDVTIQLNQIQYTFMSILPTICLVTRSTPLRFSYDFKLHKDQFPIKVTFIPDEEVNIYDLQSFDANLTITPDFAFDFNVTVPANTPQGRYYARLVYSNGSIDYPQKYITVVSSYQVYLKTYKVTRWEGNDINSTVIEFYEVIVPQQITKMYLLHEKEDNSELTDKRTELKEDRDYRIYSNYIIILIHRELEKDDKYTFQMETFSNDEGSYNLYLNCTVKVRESAYIGNAILNVDTPSPGIENEYNKIEISSDNYNVKNILLIRYKRNDGTFAEISKSQMTYDIDTNSISFSIFLKENQIYYLYSIRDKDKYQEEIFCSTPDNEYCLPEHILSGVKVTPEFILVNDESEEIDVTFTVEARSSELAYRYLTAVNSNFNSITGKEKTHCSVRGTQIICNLSSEKVSNIFTNIPADINMNINNNIITKKIPIIKVVKSNTCLNSDYFNSYSEIKLYSYSDLGKLKVVDKEGSEYISSPQKIENNNYEYTFSIPLNYLNINKKIYLAKSSNSFSSDLVLLSDLLQVPNVRVESVKTTTIPYEKNKDFKVEIVVPSIITINDIRSISLKKTLSPGESESNSKMISLYNFNFISIPNSPSQTIECYGKISDDSYSGKYRIFIVDTCGKGYENYNIAISLALSGNVLTSISQSSVKKSELQNNNKLFTATYFYDFKDDLRKPSRIVLVHTDDSSEIIETNLNFDSESSEISVSMYSGQEVKLGKYKIISYINNNEVTSDITFFIYKNHLELASTNSYTKQVYTRLFSVVVYFTEEIVNNQIESIGYKKVSDQTDVYNECTFSISGKKLTIESTDNVNMTDSFEFKIKDASEEERYLTFTIDHYGAIDFDFVSDAMTYTCVNEISCKANVLIDVKNKGFIRKAVNNFYNGEGKKLECAGNYQNDSAVYINCTVDLNDNINGVSYHMYYNDSVKSDDKIVNLIYYKHTPQGSGIFLNIRSPIIINLYLENSNGEKNQLKINANTYDVYCSELKENTKNNNGFYDILIEYTDTLSTKKYIKLVSYISLSDISIESISPSKLYSGQIFSQKLTIIFNSSLVENELQKITLYNSNAKYDSIRIEYDPKGSNTNEIEAYFDLQDSKKGTYNIMHTNANGNSINSSFEITIEFEFQLVSGYTKNGSLSGDSYSKLEFINDLSKYSYAGLTFTEVDNSSKIIENINGNIVNNNSIEYKITDKDGIYNYEGIYIVTVEFYDASHKITNKVSFKSESDYIILYNENLYQFDFSKRFIRTDNYYKLKIKPSSSADVITQIIEGGDNQLIKEENEFSINLNALISSEYKFVDFKFKTQKFNDFTIKINENIMQLKSISSIVNFEEPKKCNLFKQSYGFTMQSKALKDNENKDKYIDFNDLDILIGLNSQKSLVINEEIHTGTYSFALSDFGKEYQFNIVENGKSENILFSKEISFTKLNPAKDVSLLDKKLIFNDVTCDLFGELITDYNIEVKIESTLDGATVISTVDSDDFEYNSKTKTLSIDLDDKISTFIGKNKLSLIIKNKKTDETEILDLGTIFISKNFDEASFQFELVDYDDGLEYLHISSTDYYIGNIRTVILREMHYYEETIIDLLSDENKNIVGINKDKNLIIIKIDFTHKSYYITSLINIYGFEREFDERLSGSKFINYFSADSPFVFADMITGYQYIKIKIILENSLTNIDEIYIEDEAAVCVENCEKTDSITVQYLLKVPITKKIFIYYHEENEEIYFKVPIYIITYNLYGGTKYYVIDSKNKAEDKNDLFLTLFYIKTLNSIQIQITDDTDSNNKILNEVYSVNLDYKIKKDYIIKKNYIKDPKYYRVNVIYRGESITKDNEELPSILALENIKILSLEDDDLKNGNLYINLNKPIKEEMKPDSCTLKSEDSNTELNSYSIEFKDSDNQIILCKFDLNDKGAKYKLYLAHSEFNLNFNYDDFVINTNSFYNRISYLSKYKFSKSEVDKYQNFYIFFKNDFYVKPTEIKFEGDRKYIFNSSELIINNEYKSVEINLSSKNMAQGIYTVFVKFEGQDEIDTNNQIIIENNQIKNMSNITIFAKTLNEYLKIKLGSETFKGRFKKITYTIGESTEETTITDFNTDELNYITINTNLIDYSERYYTFFLTGLQYKESEDKIMIVVNTTDVSYFDIPQQIYEYEAGMKIKVNIKDSKIPMYIQDINKKIYKLELKEDNSYLFEPLNSDDTLFIIYTVNNVNYTHYFPIYITKRLTNIFKLTSNIGNCLYIKSPNLFSMTFSRENYYRLNFKEINGYLNEYELTKVINEDDSYSTVVSFNLDNLSNLTQDKIYYIKLKYKDNELYSKAVRFTDITYRRNTDSSIQVFELGQKSITQVFSTSCVLTGSHIYLSILDDALQCQEYDNGDSSNSTTLTSCEIKLQDLKYFGDYTIYYHNISLNLNMKITRSLSISHFDFNIYNKSQKNKIEISSYDYDVTSLEQIVLKQVTGSSSKKITFCSSKFYSLFSQYCSNPEYIIETEGYLIKINLELKENETYYLDYIFNPEALITYGKKYTLRFTQTQGIEILNKFVYFNPSEGYIKINVRIPDELINETITSIYVIDNKNSDNKVFLFTELDLNSKCMHKICSLKSNQIKENDLSYLTDYYIQFEIDGSNSLSYNYVQFVSESSLPSSFETDISYSTTNNDTTVKITSDKPMFEEYITEGYLKLNLINENSNTKDESILYSELSLIDSQTLEVSIPLYVPTINSNLKITLFNKTYSNSIGITCDSPKIGYDNTCQMCSEISILKPFLNGQQCVSDCSYYDKYYYNGVCVDSCKSFKIGSLTYTDMYYEDNKCVRYCTNEGYGVENEQSVNCIKCSNKNMYAKNSFCIPAYECNDLYCNNNGACSLVNDYPECKCNEGYYGRLCDLKNDTDGNNDDDFNKHLEEAIKIINDLDDSFLEIGNEKTFNSLLDIVSMFKTNETLVMKNDLFKEFMDKLYNKIKALLFKGETNYFKLRNIMTIFDLLIKYKAKYVKENKRRLVESGDQFSEINYIIQKALEFVDTQGAFEIENNLNYSSVSTTEFGSFYIHKIKTDKTDLENYKKYAMENNFTYIDLTQNSESFFDTNPYVLLLEMSNNLIKELNENQTNKISNVYLKLPTENQDQSFTYVLHSHIEESEMALYNLAKYSEYKDCDIETYDITTKAYTDNCFNHHHCKYDYTKTYIKNKIFQHKTIKVNQTGCTYEGIDTKSNTIKIKCNNVYDVLYYLENATLPKDFQEKAPFVLSFTCLGKGNSLKKNLGFWLFLLILLVTAFIVIILTFVKRYDQSNRVENRSDSTSKGGQNLNTKSDHFSNWITEFDNIKREVSGDKTIYSKNQMFKLHPISSLLYQDPFVGTRYKICLLGFSLICLFSFNACYFTDKYVNRRINKKNVNSFFYPMQYEFGKIMASIASTILCIFLLKLIIYIRMPVMKFYISNDIRFHTHKFKLKFVITLAVMSPILLFLFTVSVGFCGIFPNTQKGLVYSWIWSLLFYWILATAYVAGIIYLRIKFPEKFGETYYTLSQLVPF